MKKIYLENLKKNRNNKWGELYNSYIYADDYIFKFISYDANSQNLILKYHDEIFKIKTDILLNGNIKDYISEVLFFYKENEDIVDDRRNLKILKRKKIQEK